MGLFATTFGGEEARGEKTSKASIFKKLKYEFRFSFF